LAKPLPEEGNWEKSTVKKKKTEAGENH